MKTKHLYFIFFFMLSGLLYFTNCRKEESIIDDPSAMLAFSSDTVLFDTVFTTIGSSTEFFMVYNNENKRIKISSIRLAGGSNSNFRINVDGLSGTEFTDIEIAPKDSMFVFVEVTVDPTNTNNPLVITDSVVFVTNGNTQDVDLVAWGQDAHFIVYDTYASGLPPYKIIAKEGENIFWQNDKPYVIYGYAVVDSTGQLTIDQGCRIHFHNNSGLWVYKGGSLKVLGTQSSPVIFEGDRLESSYDETPGQWDRIWLNEGSVDNEINYAIIKNGFIGIQAETFDNSMGNQLTLKNTIIQNMSGAGILARNYKIRGENNLVSNCAQYCVALSHGGNYEFNHCTFADYWNYSVRQTPTLILNNYYENSNGQTIITHLEKADFGNCIIYGNLEEEIQFDKHPTSGQFNYNFNHCLVRSKLNTSDQNFWQGIIKNQDPKFKDTEDDYRLNNSSPAVDAGSTNILVPNDLNGNPRDALPDIGAYEYEPD